MSPASIIACAILAIGAAALVAIALILDNIPARLCNPADAHDQDAPLAPADLLPILIVECDHCPGWDELYTGGAYTNRHAHRCRRNFARHLPA